MSFELKNFYPPNPTTARAEHTQLDVDPKGEKFAYVNGRSVIIRDIKEPGKASQYTQHMANPTVVRFSPTGTYVASGDANGNVRIWDMTKEEQTLRYETRVVSGPVKDIAWDAEGKRIMAVGEGKDRFGHVFLSDTGNTVGEVSGHSKVINACSLRPVRPYRAATASDDTTVIFYHGPPYRYELSIKNHKRFVQAVKFSPNGDYFVTAGADGLIFLYDGKTGEKIDRIGSDNDQHSSGITAVSWSPDSTQLISSSIDQTAKLWDVATRKSIQTFQLNPTGDLKQIDYQQVGNLWANDTIISLSLNGDLNYLDPNSPKPVRVIPGHQLATTDLHVTSENSWVSTCYDGKFLSWSEGQDPKVVNGNATSKQIVASAKYPADKPSTIVSVGIDHGVRTLDIQSLQNNQSSNLNTSAHPKSLTVVDDKRYLVTDGNKLNLIDAKSLQILSSYEYVNDIETISLTSNLKHIAIGGGPKHVQILSLDGDQLTPQQTVGDQLASTTSFISFAPNGQHLAIGDTRGKIKVFDINTNEVVIYHWIHHTARIYSIEWSLCGKYAVSTSLDTNVFVWSVDRPMKKIGIMRAHMGGASRASFLAVDKIISTGADGSIKVWNITHH